MKRDEKTARSVLLARILRHQPELAGIALDAHGWADVEALLQGFQRHRSMSREQLEEIVATDEKGRYAFNADHTKIRANQGHSIPVDVELEALEPPAVLYHGTADRFLPSIRRIGLVPGKRLYVHLSPDEETAVKVGRRHGRPVVLRVRAGAMAAEGMVFYRSANGVWLTKEVPPRYLDLPTE